MNIKDDYLPNENSEDVVQHYYSHIYIKNQRSNSALRKRESSFSNFRILLTVFSLYLDQIISAIDFDIGNHTLAENKNNNCDVYKQFVSMCHVIILT